MIPAPSLKLKDDRSVVGEGVGIEVGSTVGSLVGAEVGLVSEITGGVDVTNSSKRLV